MQYIHAKFSCLEKETIYRYNHDLDIFRPYFLPCVYCYITFGDWHLHYRVKVG